MKFANQSEMLKLWGGSLDVGQSLVSKCRLGIEHWDMGIGKNSCMCFRKTRNC